MLSRLQVLLCHTMTHHLPVGLLVERIAILRFPLSTLEERSRPGLVNEVLVEQSDLRQCHLHRVPLCFNPTLLQSVHVQPEA